MNRQQPHAQTEEFTNQSPPYQDIDLYTSDQPLRDAVEISGAGSEAAGLRSFGRRWGSADMLDRARQANEYLPKLERFDASGFRRDTVEFHPAYHHFMAESIAVGLHASTWQTDGMPAPAPAQVIRAARFYMAAQIETGHLCPITMTRAAVAALVDEPEVAAELMPLIASRQYDARFLPWREKTGIMLGMGMTERQGGTDVRTNTTRATRSGDHYVISGQKWFMSAPMCDAFLVLGTSARRARLVF